MNLKKIGCKMYGLDEYGSGYRSVADSYEHGNEPSGISGNFLTI